MNVEAGVDVEAGVSGAWVSQWGRFIEDEQVDELQTLGRALACVADLFLGEGNLPNRGDVEALFRVFADRVDGIICGELPRIEMTSEQWTAPPPGAAAD